MDSPMDSKDNLVTESIIQGVFSKKPVQSEQGLEDLFDDVLDNLILGDARYRSVSRRLFKPGKRRYDDLANRVRLHLATYLKEQ